MVHFLVSPSGTREHLPALGPGPRPGMRSIPAAIGLSMRLIRVARRRRVRWRRVGIASAAIQWSTRGRLLSTPRPTVLLALAARVPPLAASRIGLVVVIRVAACPVVVAVAVGVVAAVVAVRALARV